MKPRQQFKPRGDILRHWIRTARPSSHLPLIEAQDGGKAPLRPVQQGQTFAEAVGGHVAAFMVTKRWVNG